MLVIEYEKVAEFNVLNIILKYFLHEDNAVFDGEMSLSCRLAVYIIQWLDVLLVIS